jgi:RNA polymerase sigma factor (sigma-70 family)
MDDEELLREYVERRSESAFAELVSRHVNLVYSTALRLVGEPQFAQDVAQTVFIGLARKPKAVREPRALAGWLYRATRFAAASALRTEHRRRQRENDAMQMNLTDSHPETTWQSLAPHVEEAMATLDATDQNAVVLRFFQGRSLREVGAALGFSDDTAQKRVSRALDKLRLHFNSRGIGTSTALLGTMLTANAVHAAPGGLASSVTAASLAEVAGWTTTLKTMFMTAKTKIAIVGAVAIVAAVSVPVILSQRNPARGFGPVHELFLDNSGTATFLDLDTARVSPDYSGVRAGFEDWKTEGGVDIALPKLVATRNGISSFELNGADIALPEQAAPKDGLCSFELKCARIHNSSWNKLSAADISQGFSKNEPALESRANGFVLCGTYVFKTREGGMGIMQFNLYTAYPRSMRIRYKLVRS